MAFCEEHSEVMRCLGALEQGQKDVKDALIKIDSKIDKLQGSQANGNISNAVEKTKSKLLYWVIGVAFTGLIIGIINLVLREYYR